MFSDKLTIQFHGFNPNASAQEELRRKLWDLSEEAPYGARIITHFSQEGRLVRGVLTIRSAAGKFFAAASGPSLGDVLKQIVERVRRQIGRWKTLRFRTAAKGAFYEHDGVA